MPVKGFVALPTSFLAEPWHLINYQGESRLVYLVKYFGEGFPVGSITGARGYLSSDEGVLETAEPIVFVPVRIEQSWRIRPTLRNLERARVKIAA